MLYYNEYLLSGLTVYADFDPMLDVETVTIADLKKTLTNARSWLARKLSRSNRTQLSFPTTRSD